MTMQLTIKHEKKMPLLHRRDVTAGISHPHTATPKNADAKKLLAQHYNVSEEVITIHKIHDLYGTTTTMVTAAVYDTPDAFRTFALVAKKPKKQEEVATAPAQKK